LEIGKKADFILVDLDHIERTPFHDPLQALVFSASMASISQTWVDGKALYSEGKVHGIDESALRKKARELAAAAVFRAGLHDEDVATTTTLYDDGN
jgi:5-methylthioadenosine/S-adenosylhomocysteine deaminase